MSLSKQSCSIKALKCESVTVFADRAEIKRQATFKLTSGENELVIEGVAVNSIDTDSVRVEGQGDATVLDVICQSKRVEAKEVVSSDREKELKNEIIELNGKREILQLKLERLNKQTNVLNEYANKLATHNQPSDKNESSKIDYGVFLSFLDDYSAKLELLDKEIYTVQLELKELDEKLSVANGNLNNLRVPQTDQSM